MIARTRYELLITMEPVQKNSIINLILTLNLFLTNHSTSGLGSPTHRHSNKIRPPVDLSSSNCLMTGRSVNVGLHPSSGTGASSPLVELIFQLRDFLLQGLLKEKRLRMKWRYGGVKLLVCIG